MKLQTPREGVTYLLTDDKNTDAALGSSVLQRRPDPNERPHWGRVRDYVAENNAGETKALFLLNVIARMLMAFVQALLAMDYSPTPLSFERTEQAVDVGIQHTLDAIAARGEGNIALVPHDGGLEPQLQALLRNGRRVAVMGFDEFLSGELRSLEKQGLKATDLERKIHAFNVPLPRIQVINLDDCDPAAFIRGAI